MAALLTCFAVLASSPATAQDGTLRQRLKERLAQRQQQNEHADSSAAAITRPGDFSFTLGHDGLARRYLVHVPASYQPGKPMPLVVALHGGGGNMDLQADDQKYRLISKSEQAGFIAVFPNGYSQLRGGKLATWNAGACCGAARDAQVDDVGFIRRVVTQVTHQLAIDRQRIYATGMSNGAMMAYRLACDMSDVFSAIAAVAGTDNTLVCQPTKPVAVLHIHALNDDHVLFNGGAGPGSVKKSAVTDFVSVPATLGKWVQLDGCGATPRRTLDKPGAYCELYSPCRGKTEVQLCVTETGGHSWPGGQKTRGDEPPSQAISAVDEMWDFFSRQTPSAPDPAPQR